MFGVELVIMWVGDVTWVRAGSHVIRGQSLGLHLQQAQGPKTPRPITIEQCLTGTELVRTWYGVGTEQLGVFFLCPPTPPQNTF